MEEYPLKNFSICEKLDYVKISRWELMGSPMLPCRKLLWKFLDTSKENIRCIALLLVKL